MKSEYLQKIKNLKNDYDKADDYAKKEYVRGLILDLIKDIEQDKTIDLKGLDLVKKRFKVINAYGKTYQYNLAHNLNEQVSIINDSIRASPIHIKKVELKNTAMIQFTDKL